LDFSKLLENRSFRSDMNKKVLLAALVAVVLLALGGWNIAKKIVWKEPTDGVTWVQKQAGLTAVKVEMFSPADLNGIKKGDILVKINAISVNNKIEVAKNLWIAWYTDQNISYQILREGEAPLTPTFFPAEKGVHLIYFYLVLIGLTTLIIGIIIFFNSKRPLTLPYVIFFLLTVSFYGIYVFSPTGQLDALDSIFFWLDKIAFLAFPPLLLHFFLIFPIRKKILKKKPSINYILYLPSTVFLLGNILFQLPLIRTHDDAFMFRVNDLLQKLDLSLFALFSLIALDIIIRDYRKAGNLIIKKQLKWIAYGLSAGIIPFTLLYIIPYTVGRIPSRSSEFFIVFQALIPLTCAYSLSRYKLMDLEVILKKAVTLIFSYVVIAILYFVVSSRTQIFSENRFNALILGILAIILGATLFTPLTKLIQSILDRAIYKRSYKYRKTLLSISQEISRERNLHKLSQSILELIGNALLLEDIALLLPEGNRKNIFSILESRGNLPLTKTHIIFEERLSQELENREFMSSFSLAEKRDLRRRFDKLSSMGFYHLLPLKVENKLIGCLAMGKRRDNTFLTSEDWELLRTISSPVALALENAYLYDQVNLRAHELERLKDYSENIIESLTVGVAVLDQKGRIIGWNRVSEEIFGITENEVREKRLADVLGKKNFSALFPPDTQQGFRLLSEITLEMSDGGKKIFDITKTPLLDNQMKPYGTVIVFEDITEKITMQQQLLTSEKLASIGLLSAGVAHEINTPLTGISSHVQLLQKKLSDSTHSQVLEKIEAQTERVAKIVKNLLNFARNPSEASFHKVNLSQSLQEIISLIEYKLKNMNIDLALNILPIKPIWAQGERIQQVFINIILNAMDAMPEGGKLKIELSQTDNQAVVVIEDTGTGIRSQHLPHIFDPFFTTKGIGKGTGLGLSISYAIIKEHEGRVTVESESGKGSRFTIFIPMDLDRRKINKSLPS
jgi:two-component system NtrC family sensor kinase